MLSRDAIKNGDRPQHPTLGFFLPLEPVEQKWIEHPESICARLRRKTFRQRTEFLLLGMQVGVIEHLRGNLYRVPVMHYRAGSDPWHPDPDNFTFFWMEYRHALR